MEADLKRMQSKSTVWAYIEELVKSKEYKPSDVERYRDRKSQKIYLIVSVVRNTRNKNAVRPLLLLNTYNLKAEGTSDRVIAYFNRQGVCAGVETYREVLEANAVEVLAEVVSDPNAFGVYLSDNFGLTIKGPNAGYMSMVTQAVQIVHLRMLEFIANMHRPIFLKELYGGVCEAAGSVQR